MTPSDQSRGADVLVELAGRVQAATGANYALEVEIFKAMRPEYAGYVEGRGGLVHPQDGSDMRVLSDVRPPAYTASLDAALSLVPEGWRLELTEYPKVWTAVLADKPFFDDSRRIVEADAATPALALTAACLRARAHGDTRS